MSIRIFLSLFPVLLLTQCTLDTVTVISSPNGKLTLRCYLTPQRQVVYAVNSEEKQIVLPSTIGMKFKDKAALHAPFSILAFKHRQHNSTWKTTWGEQQTIHNNYNELRVLLKEDNSPFRTVYLLFRVYNDGIGFRYEFPTQPSMKEVQILTEQTQFRFHGDPTAWWIPGDYNSYNYAYQKSLLSKVNAETAGYTEDTEGKHVENLQSVNTPVTLYLQNKTYVSLHEANLTNYAGMTLAVRGKGVLETELVPGADGVAVKTSTPFVTPWRAILIAEEAKELLTSRLILNLNEPNKLDDVSWVKPLKYTAIRREMQLGFSRWEQIDPDTWEGRPPPHGASTANALSYLQFNVSNEIEGFLPEGWNKGWEQREIADNINYFQYTTPTEDFNLPEILTYCQENHKEYMMHNETDGNIAYYEQSTPEAFKQYQQWGIHYVQTDYSKVLLPRKEFRHGQFMINHHRKILELAAQHQINILSHNPIMPTGLSRTYPNLMTSRGVLDDEESIQPYQLPVNHSCIVPFTRQLAGAVNYAHGYFRIKSLYRKKTYHIPTTLAKQLAQYVTLFSPIKAVPDIPRNYYQNTRALKFIRDVPTHWDTTLIHEAAVGEYLTVIRKKRGGDAWYIGSITNEEKRSVTVKLDFLPPHRNYRAVVYADGEYAHWKNNPTSVSISSRAVTNESTLFLILMPGGGAAVSITPQ